MSPEDHLHESPVDWSSCTWQGARQSHLKTYRRLCFKDKLQAIEDWCELARLIFAKRQQRGQPTLPLHTDDPATQKANQAAQGQ